MKSSDSACLSSLQELSNTWIAETCLWIPWTYAGDLVAQDLAGDSGVTFVGKAVVFFDAKKLVATKCNSRWMCEMRRFPDMGVPFDTF